MRHEDYKKLEYDISKLVDLSLISNKKIVTFGANGDIEVILKLLKRHGIELSFVIDNNKKGVVFNIPIFSPSSLFVNGCDNYVVLISSIHYGQMVGQLISLGFKEQVNIFRVGISTNDICSELSHFSFAREMLSLIKGMILYKQILKKYSRRRSLTIFVSYGALGENYIIAQYLEAYLAKNCIDNWIFAVEGRVYEELFNMFGFTNTIVLNKKQCLLLKNLKTFMGKSIHIETLYARTLREHPIPKLYNFKGLNFVTLYKQGVLGLAAETPPSFPCKFADENIITNIISQYSLIEWKTAILFPYAYSSGIAHNSLFWENITRGLLDEGYKVFTNCGNHNESAIEGTLSIFIPLNALIPILEYCGWGLFNRSGICEVVSSANSNLTIFYPNLPISNFGDFYDMYSLKANGLNDLVEEYVVYS